ncbi:MULTISPECIES: glutamate-5-semialdehyde dehydrogenase [unclassified Roseofilum]|uniref:glutamate-5-semialdehyde dehydrogenase n=1 Tax=unclassified Roseofilum TaxID=2620099 RepID=UPI000E92DE01|nr:MULTISPECIES: glutamate-5-semialdehyde dehydrogenase [unclassified Roseofilum]MBP0009417.1 glutamate-5-semialdehyde dehydrogenase [Roseofilum sp. Belize Diploria]MBP0031953.1 glutamate-5-semialdehyde dehydrogenase [Roseofilum sp. Belize BBD 4]HBQ98588.1 glutamate-5-semialdehyde dehydrogenase [Cyanobacteria bacterium UBA11691]
MTSSNDLLEDVGASHEASLILANTSSTLRDRALKMMAEVLDDSLDRVLEANTLDLETSREMAVPDLILEWLKLTPERIQNVVQILQGLSDFPDPLQEVMNASYQVEEVQTYCQRMPLGVLALVYEAFPELGAIAAGLCLKTGNSLILRGGSESFQTNYAIAEALQVALEEVGLPQHSLILLSSEQGAPIRDVIRQDRYINLIIPYGRPSLVEQVVRQATVPVLRSAMGNCYLYWGNSGSLETVRHVIIDSHASEPDPVNAIEKVLIEQGQSSSAIASLWKSLKEKGFELRGDPELVAQYEELKPVEPEEWNQAYLEKVVTFKLVEDLDGAIAWMNTYSSGHANCLVTQSYNESRKFALGINSASLYINASPRFYRYRTRGNTVFLGMSNQKGLRRGLINLEALTTVKYIIQGNT